MIGVPLGLVVGGLASDFVGDAATFAIAAGAVVLALAGASVTVPDLRAPIAARPSLIEAVRAMRDRRLLAVGALNFGLMFAGGGMVLTTLALLVHERHVSVLGRDDRGTAGLLMGGMVLVDAAVTPILGRIGDRRHAHARVATGAMVALAAGLVVIALSPSVAGLLAGLALVGVGGAGLGPSLLVLMSMIIPKERRGTGVGLLQLCGDFGGMLGPLVGTALLEGSTAVPYLVTAALVASLTPIGLWLSRVEAAQSAK